MSCGATLRATLDKMQALALPPLLERSLAPLRRYLVYSEGDTAAAVIDPAEADAAVAAAKELGLSITTVLTTHHHFDHAGGNNDMKRLVPSVEVVGGEPVQGMTRKVVDGETLAIGSLTIRCVHTPAHTNGHMSYLATPSGGGGGCLFTGDVLFVGGCGRFFEGGPEDMVQSMAKLASLPADTRVYCGHEYTVKNLQFALDVEPDNRETQTKMMWAQQQSASQSPTIPSSIGDELRFNPFMRCAVAAVKAYVGEAADSDEVLVMRKLRNAKDKFVGSSRPWIPGGGPLPGL